MSEIKMSRRDIKRFKNKCRLWCVLHGVKFGNREIKNIRLVYDQACEACRSKNNDYCIGKTKQKNNENILVLDTKTMRLYVNMPFNKINNRSKKNKNMWCVEWVNHV